MSDIKTDPCTDPKMMLLAVTAAKELAERCTTAIVMLTSTCIRDGHGTHVSTCLMNGTGTMKPSEARAAIKRLRSVADELEQRFCPPGSEN